MFGVFLMMFFVLWWMCAASQVFKAVVFSLRQLPNHEAGPNEKTHTKTPKTTTQRPIYHPPPPHRPIAFSKPLPKQIDPSSYRARRTPKNLMPIKLLGLSQDVKSKCVVDTLGFASSLSYVIMGTRPPKNDKGFDPQSPSVLPI